MKSLLLVVCLVSVLSVSNGFGIPACTSLCDAGLFAILGTWENGSVLIDGYGTGLFAESAIKMMARGFDVADISYAGLSMHPEKSVSTPTLLANVVSAPYGGDPWMQLSHTKMIGSIDMDYHDISKALIAHNCKFLHTTDLGTVQIIPGTADTVITASNTGTATYDIPDIPGASDTLVLKDLEQTLTQKTIEFKHGGTEFDWGKEGTFEPSLLFGGGNTSMTYVSRVGWYQRLGSVVSFEIDLYLDDIGTSTGTVTIDGLPFMASGNTVQNVILGRVNYADTTYAATTANGRYDVQLHNHAGSGYGLTLMTQTGAGVIFPNNCYIQINGKYHV